MAENFEEVQTYADPDNPSELEQKHVPMIEPNTTVVKVNVGEVKHAMDEEHWIQWIEVFVDGESQGRVDLQPYEEPKADFDVDLTRAKEVQAIVLCNLHGLWENKTKLK